MNTKNRYVKTLTIAGSDSGGGAGIQADLKTFSALGCFGMSVLTALTAQNTLGVSAIHAPPAEFVGAQLDAIYTDMGTDSVKIGMVFSAEIVLEIAAKLRAYSVANIVLDPVMIATSGDSLLTADTITTLVRELFPLASLITPNLSEAAALLQRPVHTLQDMEIAARDLGESGAAAVLLKGGHLEGEEATDILYDCATRELTHFSTPRIDTPHTHGTGCTLSAAIAAFMGKGANVKTAVGMAKSYVSHALQSGSRYQLGKGSGPVDHFWESRT